MSTGFEVRFARDAEVDLALIFDHLLTSYLSFDEPFNEAFERAAVRVREIRAGAERLSDNPYRGQRRDDIGVGVRYGPVGRATFWFRIDETTRVVQIVGIFFGGQDHIKHMLTRLLST